MYKIRPTSKNWRHSPSKRGNKFIKYTWGLGVVTKPPLLKTEKLFFKK